MDDQSAVTISVRGAGTTDCLRELRGALVRTGELRGPLHLGHQVRGEGVLDTLTVAVDLGGALAVLAATTLSWIRHRDGDVDLTLAGVRGDAVEVSASQVRTLDEAAVRAEVVRLVAALG